MKSIPIFLDILLVLPTIFFASYLAFLTFAASLKRTRRNLVWSKPVRRFAVLVPSHNEQAVIEDTLNSLAALEYPRDHYDVVVIADNCTDKTAEIAGLHNTIVMERSDKINKGKGQALRWCLDTLESEGKTYDAFVIIDADTVSSANLLSVMNDYLESGAECIQCSTLVTPQPGVWSPEMTRIGFLLHNYVRPLGKKKMGLSMCLNGNGMCFSANLLSKLPWTSYSRVEDLEHALLLVLNGVNVDFAPEAFVHAIMPSDSRLAESQRRRWEIARFPIIRKYTWPLISTAFRKRSVVILDMLMELITPAFVNLFAFTTGLLAVNFLAAALSGAVVVWYITMGYLAALMLEILHVLGGLKVSRADMNSYLVLINTPKYAMWKLKLYLKALANGDDKTWLRTEREQHATTKN